MLADDLQVPRVDQMIDWQFDDGGMLDTNHDPLGFFCVPRAIAIAERRPFEEVYRDMIALDWKPDRLLPRRDVHAYLKARGWRYHRAEKLMRLEDLPRRGDVIAFTYSQHCVAVIDGVLRDLFDSRVHPETGEHETVRCWYDDEQEQAGYSRAAAEEDAACRRSRPPMKR
jgi:hypothetical protein